jgi:hypothetical protein
MLESVCLFANWIKKGEDRGQTMSRYSGLRETCPSFGHNVLNTVPHVAEIEIEKVRKKDTFTAIRCKTIVLSLTLALSINNKQVQFKKL